MYFHRSSALGHQNRLSSLHYLTHLITPLFIQQQFSKHLWCRKSWDRKEKIYPCPVSLLKNLQCISLLIELNLCSWTLKPSKIWPCLWEMWLLPGWANCQRGFGERLSPEQEQPWRSDWENVCLPVSLWFWLRIKSTQVSISFYVKKKKTVIVQMICVLFFLISKYFSKYEEAKKKKTTTTMTYHTTTQK